MPTVEPKIAGPTMGGATRSLASEPAATKRSGAGRAVLALGAVALLGGGVAVAFVAKSGPHPATAAAVMPLSPVSPDTSTATTAPVPSITVGLAPLASATASTAAAPSASVPVRIGGAPAGGSYVKPSTGAPASAATTQPSAGGTRVDQRGLAKDNPFK